MFGYIEESKYKWSGYIQWAPFIKPGTKEHFVEYKGIPYETACDLPKHYILFGELYRLETGHGSTYYSFIRNGVIPKILQDGPFEPSVIKDCCIMCNQPLRRL